MERRQPAERNEANGPGEKSGAVTSSTSQDVLSTAAKPKANEARTLVDIVPPPTEGWVPSARRFTHMQFGPRGLHGVTDVNHCARSAVKEYQLKQDAPRRWSISNRIHADKLEAQPDGTLIVQHGQAERSFVYPGGSQVWAPDFPEDPKAPYVVLGNLHDDHVPSEVMMRIRGAGQLFKIIHRAIWILRPFPRRYLSLKRVVDFCIYECDPITGSHRTVELTGQTELALKELWRDFNQRKTDDGDRWRDWITANLNANSSDTVQGTLTLGLVLQWSPYKLAVWGLTPFLLSLAVGFWYSFTSQANEDHVAIVQTGWTIASYIVTCGARKHNRRSSERTRLNINSCSGTPGCHHTTWTIYLELPKI